MALPPGGGARFRKAALRLRQQRRADRDDQIRELLAQGYRNKAIARKLGIDVKTVRRVRKGARKRKPHSSSKLDAFKPDFVLISCGFDSHENDTLGKLAITTQGFGKMTRIVKEIAAASAKGRIVSMLEDFGHDEADMLRALKALLTKIPEAE